MTAPAPIHAWLSAPVPAALEVGAGNVLALAGALRADAPARVVEAAVGPNRAPPLARAIPAPGELRGREWWQAIVPIAAVHERLRAPISLRVARAGGEVDLELGEIELAPGPAPAGRRGDGPAAPAVAVCLATHEPEPRLLAAQLDSLRAQELEDWICIVSDDASSGAGRRAIEQAVGGDERFRVLRHERRVGFYRNFERALRAVPAGARYVALCDQDDRWHPDKLATLIAALAPGDLLAHSDARVTDADGRLLRPGFWPAGRPRDDELGELLLANPVTGASALLRRELLDLALPFPALPGRAFHDRWLALVARARGGIAYVPRPLLDYVQHEGAVHGHGRATGSGPSAPGRLRRLRRGELHPNWRAAHDDVLARSVAEATVLRLRFGAALEPGERRALRRVEELPRARRAQARLMLRWALRAPRRRPGLEGALVRALAWRRLVPARNALAAARRRIPRRGRSPGGGAPAGGVRLGLVVTSADERAGFGDLHPARELGAALERLGFEISLLELRGGGRQRPARGLDVVLSLLDRFPADELPADVAALAWVRNWAERWLEREWFGRYDAVFASSIAARELIARRAGREAELLPLATNPERFRPVPPRPELAADLTFAGSHWGARRQAADVLPELAAAGVRVRVFGRGWEQVPGMRDLTAGPLPYEELPAAYCSARVVLDDSGPHARPWGAVNSRVFDALACGALVASNDGAGVRALFDAEFPAWSDAASLLALVERARSEPDWARATAARYRARVLAEHTYERRAAQLREGIERALAGRRQARTQA